MEPLASPLEQRNCAGPNKGRQKRTKLSKRVVTHQPSLTGSRWPVTKLAGNLKRIFRIWSYSRGTQVPLEQSKPGEEDEGELGF